MKLLYNSLFLHNRLFYLLGGNACLFIAGFFIPFFFDVAKVVLLLISALTVIDIFTLFLARKGVSIERTLPERLSNGDQNRIKLEIESYYKFPAHLTIIEELPFQFQKRNFKFDLILKPERKNQTIEYNVTPTKETWTIFPIHCKIKSIKDCLRDYPFLSHPMLRVLLKKGKSQDDDDDLSTNVW